MFDMGPWVDIQTSGFCSLSAGTIYFLSNLDPRSSDGESLLWYQSSEHDLYLVNSDC